MSKAHEMLVAEIEKSFRYSNADAEKYATSLVNVCREIYKSEL